jgi:hypothetical protein
MEEFMKALFSNALLAVAAVLIAATPARAIETKPGFSGSVPPGQIFQCQPGSYLIGLSENQTDRIVGVRFICVSSDSSQLWTSEPGLIPTSLGDVHKDHGAAWTNVMCPKDYFIVGWRGTFGTYSADTHGSAHVGIQLLADLAPVCRNLHGDIFAVNGGSLHQADDNNLQVTAWDGLNGARSCQPGQPAIGVLFEFEELRNDDPNNRFEDAALICDGFPVNAGAIGTTLVH